MVTMTNIQAFHLFFTIFLLVALYATICEEKIFHKETMKVFFPYVAICCILSFAVVGFKILVFG